ncbi:hypothetical protein GEMRC1_010519 [Eukaryota sp. GEM-RC1]
MPHPSSRNDFLKLRMFTFPAENRFSSLRVSNQGIWISWSSRSFNTRNFMSGHLSSSFDNFFNRIAYSRTQIKTVRHISKGNIFKAYFKAFIGGWQSSDYVNFSFISATSNIVVRLFSKLRLADLSQIQALPLCPSW